MRTLGIATIPSRVNSLERVLDSLTHQVDIMHVVLNGYYFIPPFLNKYKNIVYRVEDNSCGDAMKFYLAEAVNGCYIGWDDDLIAKDGIIAHLVVGASLNNCLVSLHGRNYTPPIEHFRQWQGNYRCLDEVKEDTPVNFIGSGCCAFYTNRLKVSLSDFILPNMSDIWLSKLATDQEVPMMILKHNVGDVIYTRPPKGTTIWENTKEYTKHLEIMKTFIK